MSLRLAFLRGGGGAGVGALLGFSLRAARGGDGQGDAKQANQGEGNQLLHSRTILSCNCQATIPFRRQAVVPGGILARAGQTSTKIHTPITTQPWAVAQARARGRLEAVIAVGED